VEAKASARPTKKKFQNFKNMNVKTEIYYEDEGEARAAPVSIQDHDVWEFLLRGSDG
jgi:hypothetical protein